MSPRKRRGCGLNKTKKYAWQPTCKSKSTAKPLEVIRAPTPRLCKLAKTSPNKASQQHTASPEYIFDTQTKRQAWAVYFIETLNAPPSDEWTTYRGAIWSIMKTFSVLSGSYGSVLSVLQDVAECAVAGVAYAAEPKQTDGVNKLIELGSIESDLIADCMEWGWGLRETTHMVNQLRLSLNPMHVGTSAVYTAYLRMNPVVTSIGALKQGNVDASSAWAKARLGWAQQLATRFGIWSWDADSVVDCPPYLDATCVTALEPSQIVSWDETHKEVKIGGYGVNGLKRQVRFRRDVNGKVHPNGELAATKSFLNMKYMNKAKFCFGCAIVDDGNGGVVGLRCNPFLYSGKWIRTIDEFEQLQQQEIRRVKALEGKGLPWFQGKRTKADVNDLKNMCDEDMRAASKLGLGITLCALRQLHMQTLEAQPGAYMDVSIDHKLAVNPYLSLYGSEWKSHIQRSNLMQGSICIMDLVEHIIQESAMVMALPGLSYKQTHHSRCNQVFFKPFAGCDQRQWYSCAGTWKPKRVTKHGAEWWLGWHTY
ncbi:hypothetical protein H257_08631 [Aphanomyces astaci]|uniref:Uncharacterized protein n=1 Tax=Aphanomyces astaci TaxID=112090 RepID=W4GDN9_APHAT|nr:hypothetical protein H257_08631 [Aphanomyces astaci]ETV77790.1 hypothetical protein H257_08631 [Aphanomyces astaci]|eukprot:XP_009832900.1 hypothetical protein H257_08631 [Aphanomyces astaci]